MKELYKLLDQLDLKFKHFSNVEKIGTYFLIVLVMGSIFYFAIAPVNDRKLNILNSKKTTLENALKNNKRALEDNEQEQIFLKGIERSNESIKDEIFNNEEAIKYIDKKIDEQHNIKFSSTQWGTFYKEVQKKAIKHNIKIINIKNENLEIKIPDNLTSKEKQEWLDKQKNKFRPIFSLKVKGVAKFKDLMDFLVDIENNKLITKLNLLNVTSYDAKQLVFHLEINLWGIK